MNLTNLSLDELNLILAGLGELPAKMVLSLINKIQAQVKPQLPPAPELPTPQHTILNESGN